MHRFSYHIRSGDNEDLLLLIVQINVVGNVKVLLQEAVLDLE